MAGLSISIIACNAARTIERTLRAVVPLAERTVVVDSGSVDGTPEICRLLGAEVVHHDWEGYGRQKQYALELCRTPWVLCLDSDEEPDREQAAAIGRAVAADDPADAGWALNRRVWIGDRELRHAWQPEWKTRLVRPGRARWVGDYHERLDVDGAVRRLPGVLRHHAVPDTAELIRKQAWHGVRAAEAFFAEGRRGSVPRLVSSTLGAVLRQLVVRSAWLDGWHGWVAAYGSGIYAAAKQMRLLELTRLGKGDGVTKE